MILSQTHAERNFLHTKQRAFLVIVYINEIYIYVLVHNDVSVALCTDRYVFNFAIAKFF